MRNQTERSNLCKEIKERYSHLLTLKKEYELAFDHGKQSRDFSKVYELKNEIEKQIKIINELLEEGKSMAFTELVDLDKIVLVVLNDLGRAIEGWLKGKPLDEVALMNRITEQLDRRRRGCDVGVKVQVSMNAEVALLHRKGHNQIDQYGSDLAVTVSAPDCKFLKTIFFQMKKSADFICNLEKRQLDDALHDARISPRSFVFAVDELRHAIRIESVLSLSSQFSASQQTKTFDCSSWKGLSMWLQEWLSCNIGPLSKEGDPRSVESLLRHYITPVHGRTIWSEGEEYEGYEPYDLGIPARAWTILEFEAKK